VEVTYLIKDNLRRIIRHHVGYHLRTKILDLYLTLFQQAKNLEDLNQLIKEKSAKAINEEEKALFERLEKIHEEFKNILGGRET
jgi:hypothetical protein